MKPPPPPVERLAVRAEDAASLLSVSTATFRRLVDQGEIPPPVRFGKIPLWVVADLRAAVDRKRGAADGPGVNPWD
jgi:predicted DNA-binding transcriptional regulator AlpA